VTGAPGANDAPPAEYLQLALNTAAESDSRTSSIASAGLKRAIARGDVAELVIGDNVTAAESRALSTYFSQKYGPTTAFVVE